MRQASHETGVVTLIFGNHLLPDTAIAYLLLPKGAT